MWKCKVAKWICFLFEAYFSCFQALRPPMGLQGPQWFQIDNLVFHERLKYNILLCDNSNMGKLGVSPMEGGCRNIWWFEAGLNCFLAQRGNKSPSRAAPEFPIVPNGQNNVSWEVWVQHLTMGSNYGKTGCVSHGRQTKEYDLNYVINVLDEIVTTHERPPRVPNGAKWNTGSMRSRDSKFYYGKG